MIISVFSLGCKVNQYEADCIKSELESEGHTVYSGLNPADIFIINTCAVTQEAERKSRQCVTRALKLNPNAKIFIIGCASEKNPAPFLNKNVKWIIGNAGKSKISELIKNENFDILPLPKEYEEQKLNNSDRTRAYVKIQDGCNCFCSYCIIPYLRGRSRSREMQSIEGEVNLLSKKTKEIVLTGINLSAYGLDINTDLTNLINNLRNIDSRIRLGSFYVESIEPRLLDALFSLKSFCPHFHLSLQSGDDNVLKAMNRHYTTEEYARKIELIRDYDKNASITTDIITAYPTETDFMHNNTVGFIKSQNFSDIHIFPYSRREGTKAYLLPPIADETIKLRKEQLTLLKKELRTAYHEKMLNVEQDILLEDKEKGYFAGYSQYYIRCFTNEYSEDIIRKKAIRADVNGLYF